MKYWLAFFMGGVLWLPNLYSQQLARLDAERIVAKQAHFERMLQRHALYERVKMVSAVLVVGAGAYAAYRFMNAIDNTATLSDQKIEEKEITLQLLAQQVLHNQELKTFQGHAAWVVRHAMSAALSALVIALVERASKRAINVLSDGYSRFVRDSGKDCLSGCAQQLMRRTTFFRTSYASLCEMVSSLSYDDALDKKVIDYHIKMIVIDHAAWVESVEDFIAMAHCLLAEIDTDRQEKVKVSLDLFVGLINDVIEREDAVITEMATKPQVGRARDVAIVLDDVCAELVKYIRVIGTEMYDDWQPPARV